MGDRRSSHSTTHGSLSRAATELIALRDKPLFSDLSEPELCAVAAAAQRGTYSRGALISPPTEKHSVAIVAAGEARVALLSREGRELTLRHREVGSVFQFGGMEDQLPGDGFVQATCDGTVLYVLPCTRFMELVCTGPKALISLATLVWQEAERDVQLIHALAFSSIRRRLAHLLVELAEAGEVPTIQRTRMELAALLGTRPEEVTKALRSLLDQGLVEFAPHGKTITLVDAERLANY